MQPLLHSSADCTFGVEHTKDFNFQDLAIMVWACAADGNVEPMLIDTSAELSPSRLKDFNFQVLANPVWAFAATGHASQALIDAIAEVATSRVKDLNSQALANGMSPCHS